MKTHVVVTVAISGTGKNIIHAYGPYTQSRAQYERQKLIDQIDVSTWSFFQVSVCKMLDI